MKKCLLLIKFLSINYFILAQTTAVDSVLLNSRNIENSKDKLDYFLTQSRRFNLSQDANQMISLLEEMYQLADNLDNKEALFESELQLSENYLILEDTLMSVKFALKLVDRLSEKDSLKYRLLAANQLGRSYYQFGKYNKAIEEYQLGLSLDSMGNIPAIGNLYTNLSLAYKAINDEDKSNEALLKALAFADQYNNDKLQIQSLYTLGWNYLNIENYEKAEEYFLKGLEIAETKRLPRFNYLNRGLGLTYSRSGQYDKALLYNDKALKHFENINDNRFIFDVLNNTAVVYNRMGNPKMGVVYAQKALKAAKILDNNLAVFVANHTKAVAYKDLRDFKSAEKVFLASLKDTIYPNIIDENSKSSIFSNLGDIYGAMGNYKKAFEYDRRFRKIYDSLTIVRQESNFTEIETRYQTEKKEKENLQLKAEKAVQEELLAQESKRKWQLGGGLGTALVGLGIFAFFYKKTKKQNTVIENLQKELHHRVKNNLAIIDSFIQVAKDGITDPAVGHKLTDLQNRIDSINQVHYQLYESKDVTHLDMREYINTLSANVSQAFANTDVVVEKNIRQGLQIEPDKSFPLGLIINEFLTNSYKYAFTDRGGKININLKSVDNQYHLTLKDDGAGLPDGFDLKKDTSFGMRIMKLLSQQINGTFELANNNGLQLDIQFPR